jgi:hypothetical protein
MIPIDQVGVKQRYCQPLLEVHHWKMNTGATLPIGTTSFLPDEPFADFLEAGEKQ